MDLFDGTPVLDIKPYRPDYRASDFRVPGWSCTTAGVKSDRPRPTSVAGFRKEVLHYDGPQLI